MIVHQQFPTIAPPNHAILDMAKNAKTNSSTLLVAEMLIFSVLLSNKKCHLPYILASGAYATLSEVSDIQDNSKEFENYSYWKIAPLRNGICSFLIWVEIKFD